MALTSAVVDVPVQCAPARAAKTGDGAVWIEPAATISRAMLGELKKLGVECKRKAKADFQPLLSWQEALPPVATPDAGQVTENAEVLFEIDGEQQLPLIVTEMLRLGNDRQSFRYVGENGAAKTLLRVTAPPYYTMLRALDASNAGATTDEKPAPSDVAIKAYTQQNSRVWVEAGYRHPLGEQLSPPAGAWLLISRRGRWRFFKEGSFRDVYEVLDFVLPEAAESFVDSEPRERIRVPLKFAEASIQDAAELWVLTGDAMCQVEKLVRRSDDKEISRLAFAVVEEAGLGPSNSSGPTVILRARPSKQSPPVLVLDAVACRPYLKIPNLFLPVARRLHPPLRRDAVVNLLAKQPEQITWLMPVGDGGFTPQSIPDTAFRPMSDWIDYVLDHDPQPLKAWVASHRFDFEHFVCRDDLEKRAPSPPPIKAPPKERLGGGAVSVSAEGTKPKVAKKTGTRKTKNKSAEYQVPDSLRPERKSDELQLRLHTLENDFRQSDEPLDSPLRASMWKEMARVHAALKCRHDATICWVNSIWEQPKWHDQKPTGTDEDSFTAWLRCEQHNSAVGTLTPSGLDEWMSDRTAGSPEPTLVAAYLAWAASRDEPPSAIADRQAELTQFLLRQQHCLPIRAAWLAWSAMYSLSGNDVLLLARARDRLLERLFHQGLAPELDMATFLRTGGNQDSDRFRVLREQVLQLRKAALAWVVEADAENPQTKCYADLIFAFVLARLGETARCKDLLEKTGEKLNRGDPIHGWLFRAYRLRIQQALAGQATQGHLSDELLAELESMDRFDRYKIDKLRYTSRILEPHSQFDPYINWHKRPPDQLIRELTSLQKISDGDELRTRIAKTLDAHEANEERVQLLPGLLHLSPRVGEKFACRLLDLVPTVLAAVQHSTEKSLVLQSALYIAAHFGRADLAHRFVVSLRESLPELVAEYLQIGDRPSHDDKATSEGIESLLRQSFRGLRKLGMRDEIADVYGKVAELVENAGKKRLERQTSGDGQLSRGQRLLLCVAGGWFFFGEEKLAREVVDAVLVELKEGGLKGIHLKNLTCNYLAAVSAAPVDEAIERVEQVFVINAKGVREVDIQDPLMTKTHFSVWQLDVIEAALTSLVSDDFTLSADARRWLDEDEFLVRSRIHRDMRRATTD